MRHAGSMDKRDARPAAQLTPTSLSGDVEAALRTAASAIGNLDMLVLPPYERGGRSMYGPDDVGAVRLAREAGTNAAFLQKAADREYLHEFSAGWVIEFAIALGANVAAAGIAGAVTYVKLRARDAVRQGLHPGPDEEVPVRMTVARIRRTTDGETSTAFRVEGPAEAVADALRTLLAGESPGLASDEPGPQKGCSSINTANEEQDVE